MKKLLGVLLIFILLTMGLIVLYNAATAISKQSKSPLTDSVEVSNQAITRLALAVRKPTIPTADSNQLDAFKQFIQQNYAAVLQHHAIEYQYINKYCLVLKWAGRNPNAAPVLLTAHQDVLDPELEHIPEWTYNPFMGKIIENRVWGRGTQGGKASMMAILEGLHLAIQQDVIPERSLYCVFTHDSYQPVQASAKAVTWMFTQAKINFEMAVAAGNGISRTGVLGINSPLALLGTASRNQLQVRLSSSQANLIEESVANMQNMPLEMNLKKGTANAFWEYMSPEMSFVKRLISTNLWLLAPFAKQQIEKDKLTKAILQIPINIDSIIQQKQALLTLYPPADWTLGKLGDALNDRLSSSSVQIELMPKEGFTNQLAANEGYSFNLLQTTIKQIFDDVLVTPSTTLTHSDALFFTNLTPQLYYFSPFWQTKNELLRLNDVDDAISIEEYKQAVRFYHQLIINMTK